MLADSIIGLIRTVVPSVAGLIVTWLVARGLPIDTETVSAALGTVLFGLCTAIYYALATLLERKVNPWFGVLLGATKAPTYSGAAAQGEVVGGPSADALTDGAGDDNVIPG